MNILIFRTDRIGDLLITCPSIITIKKYFKDCQVSLVCSDKNYSYAKRLKLFDQIYKFPKKSIIKKLFFIKMLKRKKFDYIFVFDGKERSIIVSKFIKANFKVALTSNIKKYYRFTDIMFLVNNTSKKINEIFQEALSLCKINVKIEHYNFLKMIEDNKYSSFIPIKNYIHIHLDEKWFSNLYISKYTDIKPEYEEFIDFINTISEKKNILITSGSGSFLLIEELKAKYFEEKSNNIFIKKNFDNFVYFADKTTFYDIESLLRNSDILIACHGAITHAANSFDVIKIDIIEKDKEVFYKKFTGHLDNYNSIYREDFILLKKTLYKKITSYE
jgi:ADP-heptose:LPS heptosyltransferase